MIINQIKADAYRKKGDKQLKELEAFENRPEQIAIRQQIKDQNAADEAQAKQDIIDQDNAMRNDREERREQAKKDCVIKNIDNTK